MHLRTCVLTLLGLLIAPAIAHAAVLGSTTTWVAGTPAHAYNIDKAARAIDQRVLQPGQVFSLNHAIGPMGEGSGYLTGRVFVDDHIEMGFGGGICQVASTLYSAALKAGLGIVERHPHTMLPGYLPPGQDATVWEGLLDLRLRNEGTRPLQIRAALEGQALTVSIFARGDAAFPAVLGYTVLERQEPPVQERVTAVLASGERRVIRQGMPQLRVEVWRERERDGKLEHERIGIDAYRALPTIMEVGQKPSEASLPKAS